MEKTIAVKWIRSVIGRTDDQKKTIRGLGFKRLHQTLTLPDRPEIRGMINRVIHLLEVNPSTPRPEGQGSLRVDPEGRFLTP
ncbi:MAG: 50S ribosomal protein L30, partial [Deltaproteobacteria bacterium CG_4_8_14_3_um_filter_45_9]